MQKQVVIFSLALAAVSTGTAVWLAVRGPQAPVVVEKAAPNAATAAKSMSPATAADAKKPGSSASVKQLSAEQLIWEKDAVGIGGLVREDVQVRPQPPRPANLSEVTPAELAKRVAAIEKETNHEMKRLVGLLNLNDEQQDKVYERLAASSRHWVPGMAIAADGGSVVIPDSPKTSSGTPTDASEDIMSLLSADQQDTLLQAEMDRAAWWAEIITQLDAQSDVPDIDGSTGSTEGAVKEYEGASGLE